MFLIPVTVWRVARRIPGTQLTSVLVKPDSPVSFLLLFSSVRKQFLLDHLFIDEFDSFFNYNVCFIHSLLNSY